MNKYFIISNGCIRRKKESQSLISYLNFNGYERLNEITNADYIIFISCGFSENMEIISKTIIEKIYNKKKKDAVVIFGGCLPKIDKNSYHNRENLHFLDLKDYSQIENIIPPEKVHFNEVSNFLQIEKDILNESGLDLRNLRLNFRTPAENGIVLDRKYTNADESYHNFKNQSSIVIIAKGCISNCSYCSIKKATGTLISRSISDIIKELYYLDEAKINRFTLTAEDTGAYGLDIKTDITTLLKNINTNFKGKQFSITGLNPTFLIKQLNQFLEQITDLNIENEIKHIVIPIQNISDNILCRMNRNYKLNDIYQIFERIETTSSKIQLHTHIIVGFPGEKDIDILELIKFIQQFKKINFKLFPYSDRKGTKAYELENKLNKDEINDRLSYIKAEIDNLN